MTIFRDGILFFSFCCPRKRGNEYIWIKFSSILWPQKKEKKKKKLVHPGTQPVCETICFRVELPRFVPCLNFNNPNFLCPQVTYFASVTSKNSPLNRDIFFLRTFLYWSWISYCHRLLNFSFDKRRKKSSTKQGIVGIRNVISSSGHGLIRLARCFCSNTTIKVSWQRSNKPVYIPLVDSCYCPANWLQEALLYLVTIAFPPAVTSSLIGLIKSLIWTNSRRLTEANYTQQASQCKAITAIETANTQVYRPPFPTQTQASISFCINSYTIP